MKPFITAIALLALSVAAASAADKPEKEAVTAKAAFEKLKTLAGDWKADAEGGHAGNGKISYKVTAAGSVLMETQFVGTDHEMISMYHLDGDNLLMTHYCAAQNQPRMKLDKAASTPDSLVFAFDGGTNFDPAKDLHIHNAKITFPEKGKVVSTWTAHQNGEKLDPTTFTLTKP